MTRRKAPRARGRGRRIVLASVFFAILMASAQVSPAFASEKGPQGTGNGKAGPAVTSSSSEQVGETSSGGESHGGSEGKKESNNRGGQSPSRGPEQESNNGKGDQGAGAQVQGETSSGRGDGAGGSVSTAIVDEAAVTAAMDGRIDKDGEPNKPPTEKYNGPCTRHKDPLGNGTGHDWHRGWGVGHNGTPTEPPPPGDGTTPGGSGTTPRQEPLLPFTPQVVTVAVRTSTTDLPEYLPFTGGESDVLLAVAACAGLAGLGLRFSGRPRLYSHRRIAR